MFGLVFPQNSSLPLDLKKRFSPPVHVDRPSIIGPKILQMVDLIIDLKKRSPLLYQGKNTEGMKLVDLRHDQHPDSSPRFRKVDPWQWWIDDFRGLMYGFMRSPLLTKYSLEIFALLIYLEIISCALCLL